MVRKTNHDLMEDGERKPNSWMLPIVESYHTSLPYTRPKTNKYMMNI